MIIFHQRSILSCTLVSILYDNQLLNLLMTNISPFLQKNFADLKKLLHGMRQSAATSGNKPAQVYANEIALLEGNNRDEVLEELTDESSVRRNLRKYRSGLTPPNPANLAELLIPDDPRWNCTSDGKRLPLHDKGPDAAERVVV